MTEPDRSSDAADADAPALGTLLLRSAHGRGEQAAVQALVDDEVLLERDNIRAALVMKVDGAMSCHWEGLHRRLHTLGLDEEERTLLGLLLSMVGVGQVPLTAVRHLGECRLAIVLRAIARLADNESLAVGRRI